MRKGLVLAVILGLAWMPKLDAAIISWNTAGGQTIVSDTFSESHFNDATLTFASGIVANQLFDVTDSQVLARFQNGSSGAQTVTLDLLVDGNWQIVWSNFNPIVDNIGHVIDTSIPTPIAFTGGTVTAMRFTSDPNGLGAQNTFAGFDGSLKFDFRQTAAAVPEPATLTMFGISALGFAGAALRRRKLAA